MEIRKTNQKSKPSNDEFSALILSYQIKSSFLTNIFENKMELLKLNEAIDACKQQHPMADGLMFDV